MIENIDFEKELSPLQANELNPLSLAFVGDSVWTLLVREFFCKHTSFKNNNLHKVSTKFVKASYQAMALGLIENFLNQAEQNISRRARNTKLNTIAKNASLSDYKKATSFEAVVGYLYLTKNFERLNFIFDICKNDFLKEINK